MNEWEFFRDYFAIQPFHRVTKYPFINKQPIPNHLSSIHEKIWQKNLTLEIIAVYHNEYLIVGFDVKYFAAESICAEIFAPLFSHFYKVIGRPSCCFFCF